ncbi:hypothetical protein QBC40DRAFT_292227 [Triangularia verruculosa]|uniref:Uncharacterized protein n=1 Tax=Triangularia verruculosa TaxID=2587418 RepID=A0AAN6XT40_9PEZI|nr:hypothetical protein QBC40DRAFT_292227 [Triangularia verruculosa]
MEQSRAMDQLQEANLPEPDYYEFEDIEASGESTQPQLAQHEVDHLQVAQLPEAAQYELNDLELVQHEVEELLHAIQHDQVAHINSYPLDHQMAANSMNPNEAQHELAELELVQREVEEHSQDTIQRDQTEHTNLQSLNHQMAANSFNPNEDINSTPMGHQMAANAMGPNEERVREPEQSPRDQNAAPVSQERELPSDDVLLGDDLDQIKLQRHAGPGTPDHSYKFIIKSENHFNQLCQQYLAESDHPEGDRLQTDIPLTDAEKETKKRELYDVLTAQYPGPENFQITGVKKLHPDQLEFAAYGTLLAVIRMSQGKVGALKTHKDLRYVVYDSFSARWNALLELLRSSKAARFDFITKPGMMERFAADPAGEKSAKGMFAKNNLRKNAEGKAAHQLESHKVIKKRRRDDGGWDIVTHNGDVLIHQGPALTA